MILTDKLQEIYVVESGTIFLLGTTSNSILSVSALTSECIRTHI